MKIPQPLYESDLTDLKLLTRGKVRDIYQVDDSHLLLVASDRMSAFDVVMSDPIPAKGAVLTRISNFWFDKMQHIIPNHLEVTLSLDQILNDKRELELVTDRAVVVKRLTPLPVEAIVRGYLIGSGWKDYQSAGRICGIELPAGLRMAEKLPEPIYTPSTKAQIGTHDANITFEQTVEMLGRRVAEQVREASLRIYTEAAAYARQRGIIIADTKFEFGLDAQGEVVLIDELLTPDSSRFWPLDQYQVGVSPPSFDKQYLRDYLETLSWNKTAPAPALPPEVIERCTAKYLEAEKRLLKNE